MCAEYRFFACLNGTPTMKIEQRNPRELKHYKLNAKQHPEAQVKGIVESIKRFGFIQPVVVDKNDEIIIGHGRTMAAMQAGLQEVPTVKLENLTEQEVKALRLIDNRIAETGWDADLLKIDLENLDIDLKPFAVDFSAMMPEPEKEVVEDDGGQEATNELTMKWGVELGQVWQLGDHRVMCGDSTKEEDVARLMDEQRADLMLTDPPYNIDYTGKTKDALKVANDSMGEDDFRQFLVSCFKAGFQILKPGASYYIFHSDSETYNLYGAVKDCQQLVRQCLIWTKDALVMGRRDYQQQHEPCLYGWKEGASHGWYSDRKQTTLLRFDRPKRSEQHPTMKPVAMFAYLMGNSTAPQGLTYDPFLGSGTTLIAAEQLGRKCYGMEISPDYVAVILQRWADFTGKTPELAEV